MECLRDEENLEQRNRSYEPRERKGICCEYIRYHRGKGQLPACYSPDEAEKTYDRSVKRFLDLHG